MPFVTEILQYKSVSIVGMEKNTGKTVCLNHLLNRLNGLQKKVAITSIGVDGENVDAIAQTPKPEIVLQRDNIFVTSELFYKQKKLTAEILELSDRRTAAGRLITAKTLLAGRVIISGPTSSEWLRQIIGNMATWGADITLVDGALSRKSSGSPSVTDAMILTTGAALSPNINELARKTQFLCQLINLPCFHTEYSHTLLELSQSIWAVEESGITDLNIPSSLLLEEARHRIFSHGYTVFVSGIVTDGLMNFLRLQKVAAQIVLIVKDFTKLFISPESYHAFIARGGKIEVLMPTHLIAVCVNPTSPQGYVLNAQELCAKMQHVLQIPVYDIVSGVCSS